MKTWFRQLGWLRLSSRINLVNALQFFQLFRFGSAILIGVLMAKSSLSVEEISIYEFLLYIGTIASFFWVNASLQTLSALIPKSENEDQWASRISTAFILFILISLSITALLWWGGTDLAFYLTGREALPYYFPFLFFIFLNLPTSLVEYIYLFRERPFSILIFGALSFGAYLLAVVLPIYAGYGLEYSIRAIVGVAAARMLWLIILIVRQRKWQWDSSFVRSFFWMAGPLMLYSLLAGFAGVFDNWLVGYYFSADETFAIYRYGARELPLATALVAGLSAAMIPALSGDMNRGLQQLKEKSTRIYHWLFPLSILLMATSQWWFPKLYSEAFLASALIFNIYLLLVISRVLMPNAILIALQETRVILIISVVELIVNVGLSLWWVQYWGLAGIAGATVVAFMVEKIGMMLYLWSRHRIAPGRYQQNYWLLAYSFLLLICFLFSSGFKS